MGRLPHRGWRTFGAAAGEPAGSYRVHQAAHGTRRDIRTRARATYELRFFIHPFFRTKFRRTTRLWVSSFRKPAFEPASQARWAAVYRRTARIGSMAIHRRAAIGYRHSHVTGGIARLNSIAGSRGPLSPGDAIQEDPPRTRDGCVGERSSSEPSRNTVRWRRPAGRLRQPDFADPFSR
jgi:hypothetical protein